MYLFLMIFMFKGGLSWEKNFNSDSSSKREISGTKFELFFSWFSICAIFISWLLTIFYASDVYAELSDEDAELSLDLRDLEELPLLNLLIILLIVT